MATFTPAQVDALRDALLLERRGVLSTVSALEDEDAVWVAAQCSEDNRIRSEGDADSVAVERHRVAQLGAGARVALEEIDEALTRLAQHTYGVCLGCGSDIPWLRLEARPRTTSCVPCASRR